MKQYDIKLIIEENQNKQRICICFVYNDYMTITNRIFRDKLISKERITEEFEKYLDMMLYRGIKDSTTNQNLFYKFLQEMKYLFSNDYNTMHSIILEMQNYFKSLDIKMVVIPAGIL